MWKYGSVIKSLISPPESWSWLKRRDSRLTETTQPWSDTGLLEKYWSRPAIRLVKFRWAKLKEV